jgi:hypothetical protein
MSQMSMKGNLMQGNVKIMYKVLCDGDKDQIIPLSEILKHEAVKKAIKSSYTNSRKNIDISYAEDTKIMIEPEREIFEMLISKNDIIDMVELAEADAKKHKPKKGCERIEIIDFETVK